MERNPAFSLATEWPIFSERAQLVGDERFRRKQSAIRLEIASSHASLLEGSRFELPVPRQMGHRFVTWLSSVTQPPSAPVPHEHTLSRQCGDLGVGETTGAQHRLAMLVKARWCTSGSARRP